MSTFFCVNEDGSVDVKNLTAMELITSKKGGYGFPDGTTQLTALKSSRPPKAEGDKIFITEAQILIGTNIDEGMKKSASALVVQGVIESYGDGGGVRFPDNRIQRSASPWELSKSSSGSIFGYLAKGLFGIGTSALTDGVSLAVGGALAIGAASATSVAAATGALLTVGGAAVIGGALAIGAASVSTVKAAPNALLTVVGPAVIGGTLTAVATNVSLTVSGALAIGAASAPTVAAVTGVLLTVGGAAVIGAGVTAVAKDATLTVKGLIDFQEGSGFRFSDGTTQETAVTPHPWTKTDKVLFYKDGNVAIGTDVPGELFSVAGIIQSTFGGIMFPNKSVQLEAATPHPWIQGELSSLLYPINTVTKVGIGTQTPQSSLDVQGLPQSDGDIPTFSVRNAAGIKLLWIKNDLNITTETKQAGGSTQPPEGKAEQRKSFIYINPNLPPGDGLDFHFASDGQIFFGGSSEQYKQDIRPLEEDVSVLLQAQPISFTYKETGQESFGYTAEALDRLGLHRLVSYDDAGQPLSIHYQKIGIYLLEIAKIQQKRIATLAETLDEQRELIEALRRGI